MRKEPRTENRFGEEAHQFSQFVWLCSPSLEAKLFSLWGSSGPTGKSSARERMTLLLDIDDRGRCGLPTGDGDPRGEDGGGDRAEELKCA